MITSRMLAGALVASAIVVCGRPAAAQTGEPTAQTRGGLLKRLSIEELADLHVTSATKRSERISEVAAAITVISGDDIRRSAVSSLPEALRLVDGMNVAQVYGPSWAISTRGFTISTANKLLVMIDGRTVYSPLFGGVFWDVQDLVIADIDRIEVIRGPGGTLWGSNAVNGVINIITKRASDTQGGYVNAQFGDETRANATLRYGSSTASGWAYRAYAKFRAEDQHVFVDTGAPSKDSARFGQVGFRLDSKADTKRTWTLQGDAYAGREGLFDRADTKVSGANILARMTQQWTPSSQLQLQMYYDRTNRDVPNQYHAHQDTFDVDVQQQFSFAGRHHVVFGASARATQSNDLADGAGFFFAPQQRNTKLFGVFVEHEMSLVPDRLAVIGGVKVENNDYTGFEASPSVRLRLTPNTRQTLWGSVSRAVRMPTRFDNDLRITLPNGTLLITGNGSFKSESVMAYEVGYRTRPNEFVSFDISLFSNRYDDLRSQELPTTAGAPVLLANGLNAQTSGGEFGVSARPAPWWQMHAWYAYLHQRFTIDPSSRDITNGTSEANDPSHLFSLRNSWDIGNFQVDATLRYTAALKQPKVPAYTELTGRLGWRASNHWGLSLIAQNLLHKQHQEFAAGSPAEFIQRGISLRGTWLF